VREQAVIGWSAGYPPADGCRFYALNALRLLDAPGELHAISPNLGSSRRTAPRLVEPRQTSANLGKPRHTSANLD